MLLLVMAIISNDNDHGIGNRNKNDYDDGAM